MILKMRYCMVWSYYFWWRMKHFSERSLCTAQRRLHWFKRLNYRFVIEQYEAMKQQASEMTVGLNHHLSFFRSWEERDNTSSPLDLNTLSLLRSVLIHKILIRFNWLRCPQHMLPLLWQWIEYCWSSVLRTCPWHHECYRLFCPLEHPLCWN